MKILVTGGAGYIGSVCVEELLKLNHEVFVFDNLSEGHVEAIDQQKAPFFFGDLTKDNFIHRVIEWKKPDAIIHFAASALVGESMEDPHKYFHNNVCGGLNLLNAMVENGIKKLIFSSTCATFGMPVGFAIDAIDEETPQHPINPYGESKLMMEQMLRWFDRIHGIKFSSLRYFNVAGATLRCGEDRGEETHLIPNVLKVATGKAPHAKIFGTDFPTPDGTCIRDYIHVLDLVRAHILALGQEESDFFNLGTGGGSSVREVIDACRKVTGHPIPAEELPRRAGDPARLVASSEKARRILGWKPYYPSIEDIVDSTWSWMKSHPHGYLG